eukprot:scaffold98_cov244-Pinguiococcus_pyrenoidosus.AAC.11
MVLAAHVLVRRSRREPRLSKFIRVQRPGNPTVHTEDVSVDDGRQWQSIKNLVHRFPDLDALGHAEAILALPQEAPLLIVRFPPVDIAQLVIPAQQIDLARIQNFQGQ